MNKKQFSKVLKIAIQYYAPYTGIEEFPHTKYMCCNISQLCNNNIISYWEKTEAINKIAKLIYPWHTLTSYLKDAKANLDVEPTNQAKLDFWKQHIIGEI